MTSPPGTLFFSAWLQTSSSRQVSMIRTLVPAEAPDDPASVAFVETETSSGTSASRPTAAIAQSQVRSMRTPRPGTLTDDLTAENSCFGKPRLSLYMRSGLVTGQSRLTQKPQQTSKVVNNTRETLRSCVSPAPLSIHDLGWYMQLGNFSVESLLWAVFDSLVKKSTDLDLFEHQNNLIGNPANTFGIPPTF